MPETDVMPQQPKKRKPPKPYKARTRPHPGRPDRRKIDVSEAIKMYFSHKLPIVSIARHFKVSRTAVGLALAPFRNILQGQDILDVFTKREGDIIDSLKLTLLQDLAMPGRRAKASLNNTAYAFSQLFNAGRLVLGKTTANVGLIAAIRMANDPLVDPALPTLKQQQEGENAT